jgi:hypothetical protein
MAHERYIFDFCCAIVPFHKGVCSQCSIYVVSLFHSINAFGRLGCPSDLGGEVEKGFD